MNQHAIHTVYVINDKLHVVQAVYMLYASSKCACKVRRGRRIKGAYFTSGHTHVTHTTVTTQQFQTSAVSFGSFLDASFTAEKTTEQTRGGENLGVETRL